MNPALDYIVKQEEPFASVLMYLKAVVEKEVPNVDLKYKWRIPYFYVNNKPFCYLNCTKGYVDIAFNNATKMIKTDPYFVKEKRKSIFSLRYSTLEDVNETILVQAIQEALLLLPK